jgi:hypothetical protein
MTGMTCGVAAPRGVNDTTKRIRPPQETIVTVFTGTDGEDKIEGTAENDSFHVFDGPDKIAGMGETIHLIQAAATT